jgi:hypothetical protein
METATDPGERHGATKMWASGQNQFTDLIFTGLQIVLLMLYLGLLEYIFGGNRLK